MKRATMATSLFLMAFLVLGWLQNLHPAFDSFTHFRLHFAALLLVPTIILTVFRKWIWVLASACSVALSIGLSFPYLPGLHPQTGIAITSPSGTQIRVVQMNLRFNNKQTDRAVATLKTADADIMLLQEVTHITEGVLSAFSKSHPHQISCQSRKVGSVAILSRFPFANNTLQKCARFYGYASAQFKIEDQTIAVASFHSRWPWPSVQSRQISRLKNDFDRLPHPLILAGDFNSAPWSAAVQRVAAMTRTRVAAGLEMTWAPRFVEFETNIGALLPIDQIMISPTIWLRSRTVLADGGSDHFPVLSEFILMDK